MKAKVLLSFIAASAMTLSAQTVQERILMADTMLTAPQSATLVNPALAGFRLPVGISRIEAGFGQQGGVNRMGYFNARTYLRSKNSTIEGHASYHNGFRLNSGIYENANPELLYPYLTADEVGGRLDNEIYSFGGTYNTALADSTWLIGVQGGYTAQLECRRRDPRPKNTVGNLQATVGGAYRIEKYWVAVSASACKYKQTNEISFVSEIGESKIYHTIGMGAHYSRFAGSSSNSSYSGKSFGAAADLFPVKNQGLFASVGYDRFSFDKILTNLNRLPLASAAENSMTAQAGWRAKNFSVSANFQSGLRKGTENIFGDPMGNVYPEIASLTTFSARHTTAGLSGAYSLTGTRYRWSFGLDADYTAITQKYLGFAVPRTMDVKHFDVGLKAQWLRGLTEKITFHAGAEGSIQARLSSSIAGLPEERSFMEESTVAEYDWLSAGKSSFGVNVGLDITVSQTIAVGIRAEAGRTYIQNHKSKTNYNLSICMIF